MRSCRIETSETSCRRPPSWRRRVTARLASERCWLERKMKERTKPKGYKRWITQMTGLGFYVLNESLFAYTQAPVSTPSKVWSYGSIRAGVYGGGGQPGVSIVSGSPIATIALNVCMSRSTTYRPAFGSRVRFTGRRLNDRRSRLRWSMESRCSYWLGLCRLRDHWRDTT